ncbi:MAG: TonB-dependent receptor [Flavobacterium sp.]|nr:MAG: TonB-dependent receptor [Flavobacterium sp.]
MNYKLLLLVFMSAIFTAHAQKGTLSGKVVDKTTGQPISYATVVLKQAAKVATGVITDDNGLFEIKNIEDQNYTVEIQFMGFKTYTAAADFTTKKNISLGTVALEEVPNKLNEVTIIAERSTIEQKIDRKVITVGRDLTTAGATASEIMNNIPSVNVDQDGKLSLRGNDNVRVLVDGRPTTIDPAQLLKQIPSASIKRIELITNPSAKYNPEGMSGIINIVLHKNSNDGFNATINSSTTLAREPKSANSINGNFRSGKVNFFGTYGDSYGKRINKGSVYRFYGDQAHEMIDVVDDDESHLYKIGMDFYINDKNTISAYTNQNQSKGNSDIGTTIAFDDPALDLFQSSYYDYGSHDATYNLAYKKLFEKEGRTLDFEANFNRYIENQDATFVTDYVDLAHNDDAYQDFIDVNRKNGTINLDYVSPVNEKGNLELGAEARYMHTDDDYVTVTEDETTVEEGDFIRTPSNFVYDVAIYSAYATFGQKFEKLGYQLGLRMEKYNVDALYTSPAEIQHFEDDYITVYPSASLTYSMREKDMFQLSYSRRVDRPSIQQTNPIREFSTPTLTSKGNPELRPQFTNSVELNYTRTLSKGSFSAGVFYRIINDEISRTIIPDPLFEEKDLLTFNNFDTNTAFGFEMSANYKLTKWWDVQPSIDYSNISQKGIVFTRDEVTNESIPLQREVDVAAFNARLNANFKATKQLRFLLFGFYRGQVEGIQSTRDAMYKMDIGGRYSFANDKATFSVRFNDVFDTMKFAFNGDYPPSKGQFKWESQSLFLSFNYMFGAGKNSALQRKQREDNTNQGGGGMF